MKDNAGRELTAFYFTYGCDQGMGTGGMYTKIWAVDYDTARQHMWRIHGSVFCSQYVDPDFTDRQIPQYGLRCADEIIIREFDCKGRATALVERGLKSFGGDLGAFVPIPTFEDEEEEN